MAELPPHGMPGHTLATARPMLDGASASCIDIKPVRCGAGNLVAMREEKVEGMTQETTPRAAKRQRRSGGASPSPYSTPAGSAGPSASDDGYMLIEEDDKTSASISGRSGPRGDKEVLRIVTQGDHYDDGYRSAVGLYSDPFQPLTGCFCTSH